jgi:hypothetical protein
VTSAKLLPIPMPSTSTARRTLLLALAALAALLPVTADAHNGVGASFKGHAGPYTVYAYDGYALPHGALEYRLVLLDTANGEPADDVAVHITAAKPGEPRTTADAHSYANVVFYDLPNPYPTDWHVDVRLRGRLGPGHVSYRVHGFVSADPSNPSAPAYTVTGGTPIGLIVGGVTAGLIAAAAVAAALRRRHRRPGG